MKIEKGTVPVTWLLSFVVICTGTIVSAAVATTLFVSRVNWRLARLERHMGIKDEVAQASDSKTPFFISEAQAALKGR